MTIELTENQRKLIEIAAQNEGIFTFEFEVTPGSTKGDNYLGLIYSVKVRSKDGSKILYFMLKCAVNNEALRESFPIRNIFERETFLYATVLPDFMKFQNEREVSSQFSEIVKFYGGSLIEAHECILLENLKAAGYKHWNRKLPMNDEHIKMVFTVYAKYHSISLAMKQLEPERYNNLIKDMKEMFKTAGDADTEKSMRNHLEIIYKDVRGDKIAEEGMKRYLGRLKEFFSNKLREENDSWVIAHGDCWNNNFMFKYEDAENDQKPAQMCLLDWQLSKHTTLIHDLSYFFYSTASSQSYEHFDYYLEVYHQKLSDCLLEYGCDSQKTYPLESLKDDWKEYSGIGFFMASFIMKILLCESSEAPDFSEVAQGGGNVFTAFNRSIADVETYKNRLCDILKFMVTRDFI